MTLKTIPARLTVADLADALSVELAEVQAALVAGGYPNAPEDIVGPEVSLSTAKRLGKSIAVEPRDLALERLYESETGELNEELLSGRALQIVNGVIAVRDDLDQAIEGASDHWSVARMPLIDRTILRIGLWELREEPEIPTAVVVSEAVRLANTYSTERSGSFVNGVLAALARETRR